MYFEDDLTPVVIDREELRREYGLDEDPCPICRFDLSYSRRASQRIALLVDDEVDGWMCPECHSIFSLRDELESLGDKIPLGEA